MARMMLFALAAPALVQVGCTQGLATSAFQSRTIPEAETAELFEQGAVVMRREFGRVLLDRERLIIIAAPHRYTETRDSGTASGLVGVPSTMRRSATMRIRKRGAAAVAELRVEIEREDTRRRVAFRQESRLTDAPSHTPIESDAATTERQNTVWTLVRRDRTLERGLLNELREWAASLVEPASGEQSPPPAP